MAFPVILLNPIVPPSLTHYAAEIGHEGGPQRRASIFKAKAPAGHGPQLSDPPVCLLHVWAPRASLMAEQAAEDDDQPLSPSFAAPCLQSCHQPRVFWQTITGEFSLMQGATCGNMKSSTDSRKVGTCASLWPLAQEMPGEVEVQ